MWVSRLDGHMALANSIVIIDRDIRRVAPEAIRDARVTATVVSGEIVFQADAPR